MFKSKMKSVGVLALGMLCATSAFAQRGSVNGPVVTGPLNPASGASTITVENLYQAEETCYANLMHDTYNPFLNFDQMPANAVEIKSDNALPYPVSVSSFSLNLKDSNTPFAANLRGNRNTRFFSGIKVSHDTKTIHFGFILTWIRNNSNSSDSNDTSFSSAGLPFLDYTPGSQTVYDSITHAQMGSVMVANAITKNYLGSTPADESQIIVYNPDGSATTFRMNGQKFFQCVEATL